MVKKKIFTQVAGNTLGYHEDFLRKLGQKGAKVVSKEEDSDATILFCPIVSRFETDLSAALSTNQVSPSSATPENKKPLIVVAMHHTFNLNYPLPEREQMADYPAVTLIVHCLFFDKKGLLKCPINKKAKKRVCEKLGLSKVGLSLKKKK